MGGAGKMKSATTMIAERRRRRAPGGPVAAPIALLWTRCLPPKRALEAGPTETSRSPLRRRVSRTRRSP
jgi:hypothetical protein